MSSTFDVASYLTEEEMKRIASEEFRAVCARSSKENFERIISNSAYYMVGEAVDAHFDGGMVELLKANAIKVIKNLSSSTVFSPPNAWDRASSKGFDHMQSALDELKPMIQSRVAELIAGYNSEDLRELIERQIGDAIMNKLTS